jgi:glutathione S-transferase
MQLIGMLDSPYVRRVAISLAVLEIPFTHRPVSVFRDFEIFRAINPVVKAPTLVTDDGTVLMDSTLILDHIESALPVERRLMPQDAGARQRASRILGLALVACEKTVQIAYETKLRPPERQHQPWLDRVGAQLRDAYAALEEEVSAAGGNWLAGDRLSQADITTAVAWGFTRSILPDVLAPAALPRLSRLAESAEALAAFRAWPPH